jgi:hypothetical protein
MKQGQLIVTRPVLSFLLSKFKQVYDPEKQIPIGEGMIVLEDQLIFKVHMPDKPGRYDIKACLVLESKSGYICNMEVYAGKS